MRKYLSRASALAIAVSLAGPAFADITQTTTNTAVVTSTGSTVTTGEISGTAPAASLRVSATGALSSVSAAAVEGAFEGAPFIGNISQTTENLATVQTINGSATTTVNNAVDGLGASVAVTATGATSGISESVVGINAPDFALQNIVSNAESTANNGGALFGSNNVPAPISVTNGNVAVGAIGGAGAGAAISAGGASVDFSSSVVGATSTDGFTAVSIGEISQSAENVESAITVTDATVTSGPTTFLAGGILGDGASAGVSANGASVAVRSSVIGSGGNIGAEFGTTGGIDQMVVRNLGSTVTVSDAEVSVNGVIEGAGAGASISASGATATVGFSSIESNVANTRAAGAIVQGSPSYYPIYNDSSITIGGGVVSGGELRGNGSSLSVGATGAVGSVYDRDIASSAITGAEFRGDITQRTENRGTVMVDGAAVRTTDAASVPADVVGAGASASISATGSAVSVANSSIDGTDITGATYNGNVAQVAHNLAGVSVTLPDGQTGLEVANLFGPGSSAVVSATGSSTGVGVSSIGTADYTGGSFLGSVNQDSFNRANISIVPAAGVTTIQAADLTGSGATAAVQATGASASVSANVIDTVNFSGPVYSDVTQSARQTEAGSVVIAPGARVVTTEIAGDGARASISAVGAAASFSSTAINATGTVSPASAGAINQTATQSTPYPLSITSASINSGDLTGAGAGASISAVGASASVAGTAIGSSVITPVAFLDVTQTATNSTNVSVINSTINTGALNGAAASAGISAIGASSGVGTTSIGSFN